MMSNQDMAKLEAAKGTAFDRMFAQMMIAHHNGAIAMARDEQAKGANPQAKALAVTIEKTQTAEVATLQQRRGPGNMGPSPARCPQGNHVTGARAPCWPSRHRSGQAPRVRDAARQG
jgi:hypothetical protein